MFIKKLEKILLTILILGYVLLISKLPFGGLIFTFSNLSLAIVYLAASFALFPDKESISKNGNVTKTIKKGLFASIISGIFLSHGLLGILYQVQNWPFQGVFMMFVYILIIQTIITLILFLIKKQNVYKHILLRCLLFISMFLIEWLIQ